MMNFKQIKAMLLCVLMIGSLFLFAACGEEKPDETLSKDAEYKVTVVDALGNPYSGVVVRFLKGTEQVAMQVADDKGVAAKTLERGDYMVDLMFTGDEDSYYFEKDGLSLTAEKTELQVILSNTVIGEGRELTANGQAYTAYNVGDGCTYVELTEGMNYFLFTPKSAGTYEFSVKNSEAKIGYYGSPFFVQPLSTVEAVDNSFTQSISASMIGTDDTGTTVMVIGLEAAAGQTDAILSIERIGDAERTIEDEPWVIYQTTAELAPYTLGDVTLKDFDLTASTDTYNLVLNETDGFYHLDSADGPLVLVRLGEPSAYLESFKKILESSGITKYFFDEDENFIKKESYSECLLEYIENMDEESGVYPLTEDLKYIIQQRGEYAGWFDVSSGVYLFVDENSVPIPGINPEIAWLFMCCYVAS